MTSTEAGRRLSREELANLAHGTSQPCLAAQRTFDVIGRRWSASILLAIAQGATRFGEIRAMVTGVSDRVLAQRLKELEQHHLIQRTVIPTTPVQVQYAATAEGKGLAQALMPLIQWGNDHFGEA